MSNVCQQILALDARYNAYRAPNNPHFRTLYIRRRSQLLRENAKEEHQITARKQYLKCRSQLLSQRYGVLPDQVSTRSRSIGARSSSRITLENSDSLEGKNVIGGSDLKPRVNSRASEQGIFSNSEVQRVEPPSLPVPLCENYSFKGVHHIFDQHQAAVTCVKFANKDKSLLACSSFDGTLSICQLTPSPATVLYTLKGHSKGVTGFEWSLSNDLLLSASLDATVRLWDGATGSCLRAVRDPGGAAILACAFQPLNNNMVVMGNERGLVQVINISTGISLKGGSGKTSGGAVLCLAFDPTGRILWVGDGKGYIFSYTFELQSGCLTKGKRILVSENHAITSLSPRNWSGRDCRELLVNCAANALLLFSIPNHDGKIVLKHRFAVKHQSPDLIIRSSFCPIASYRHGTCIVTGSEDMCIYFFNVDRESSSCINKLQGHSAPVLDVSFNYDESLMASSDAQGLVIVWKKETMQSS